MNEIEMRIVDLIEKQLKDELTDKEKGELESWRQQSASNQRIFEHLTDNAYLPEAISESYSEERKERVRGSIHKMIEADMGKPTVVQMRRFTWRRMIPAAAAVILLMAASIAYFWSQNNKTTPVAKTEEKPVVNDRPPGTDGAILKLANGKEIILDNAANGNLAQEGSSSITKQGNVLAYNKGAGTSNKILYNTLRTPTGKKFQLVLPDGTKAWLNAQSSITYPTSFTGNLRKVTISGEVYLNVTKDATKPFEAHVVSPAGGKEEGIIQVLGTQFNINSYGDEFPVKTTLVEGKVKVMKGHAVALLKPGQQAQIGRNKISVNADVDINKETAWKEGLFNFQNDRLKNIMPQIARWYDVDVIYESDAVKNIVITGEIERTANLKDVLNIFSYLKINYQIEGRKLILKG